jgi:POT family proton-dependent oligopeptide transporter
MVFALVIFGLNQRHVRHADVPRFRGRSDFTRKDGSRAHQDAVATAEDLPPVLNERAQAMQAVPEWKRIMALIVIFAIVIVFWMIFHQNSITLTFWANDHTDWNVTGILSNAINPMWIILLSLPLASFWTWLDSKGLEPSTPAKMMIGMLLTAASFTILYFAALTGGFNKPALEVAQVAGDQALVHISPEAREHLGITVPPNTRSEAGEDLWAVPVPRGTALEPGDFVRLDGADSGALVVGPTRDVSPWWLILAYGVLSLGELMLSPMGLALVSKVAPIRMRGLMMGGWFAATAIGNKLTAIGRYWDLWSHSAFFIILAGMAGAMAVLLFVLLRPLKKAMPGV